MSNYQREKENESKSCCQQWYQESSKDVREQHGESLHLILITANIRYYKETNHMFPVYCGQI